MAEAVALGEGRARPDRAQSQCRLRHRRGRAKSSATARPKPGGRPHAEAVALAEAGQKAKGATLYVSLEPCAHPSRRGPACADSIAEAGPERVVIALEDPDPRTAGQGIDRLKAAGIEVDVGCGAETASESLSGYLTRLQLGRPRVTLKLALSIDGKIALPSGESKWITGEDARAHVHLARAHSDMILVGRGTYLADTPSLDVRLPGLEEWAPRRALLTRGEAVDGWETLHSPQDVHRLHDVNDLLVEGGSATATAFLAEDLVDRILIYRAPIIVGEGKSSVRLYRPRRDRRRPWPLASGRRHRARGRPARSLRAGSGRIGRGRLFTGIITDIGTVQAAEQRGDLRLRSAAATISTRVALGASIACSGVCLTVVDKGADWFAVDVSGETQSRTAADLWKDGARLNLERSLRVGDELGGHIVTGHVDAVADVLDTCARKATSTRARHPSTRSDRQISRPERLDRARRRVADRQRYARGRGRGDRFLGQHHSPHRRA